MNITKDSIVEIKDNKVFIDGSFFADKIIKLKIETDVNVDKMHSWFEIEFFHSDDTIRTIRFLAKLKGLDDSEKSMYSFDEKREED